MIQRWGWTLLFVWNLLDACGFAALRAADPATPTAATASPKAAARSFADWKAACLRAPANRVLRGNLPPPELLPLPRFRELSDRLAEFFVQCQSGTLARSNVWVGEPPSPRGFLNPMSAYFLSPEAPSSGLIQKFLAGSRGSAAMGPGTFQPFAEKLEIPAGAEVFLHADYHGDIRSLLAEITWMNEQGYLRDFSIVRPDFYLVFFGDSRIGAATAWRCSILCFV
jgi:hypothetical protein